MYRLWCGLSSNPLHLSQSLPSATWPFRTFTFISTFFHFLLSRVSLLFLTFHVLLPLRHLTLSYFYFHFYFFTLSYFYFNFYIFTLSYFYFHFYFLQFLLLLLLQRFTLLLGFFNSFFWHFTFTVLLFTCTFLFLCYSTRSPLDPSICVSFYFHSSLSGVLISLSLFSSFYFYVVMPLIRHLTSLLL